MLDDHARIFVQVDGPGTVVQAPGGYTSYPCENFLFLGTEEFIGAGQGGVNMSD